VDYAIFMQWYTQSENCGGILKHYSVQTSTSQHSFITNFRYLPIDKLAFLTTKYNC